MESSRIKGRRPRLIRHGLEYRGGQLVRLLAKEIPHILECHEQEEPHQQEHKAELDEFQDFCIQGPPENQFNGIHDHMAAIHHRKRQSERQQNGRYAIKQH